MAIENMALLVGDVREERELSFTKRVVPSLEGVSYVSVDEGKVVGFVTADIVQPSIWTLWKRCGLVEHLAVQEEERGKGSGKFLMGRVLTDFSKEEVDIATLVITTLRLEPFYNKLGFSTVMIDVREDDMYSLLSKPMTLASSWQEQISTRIVMHIVPCMEILYNIRRDVLLIIPLYSPFLAYIVYQHFLL